MYSNFVYLINCFSHQFSIVDLGFSNRYLSRLKSYMHSKTYPKDSITEGYIAKECLVFCSCYFKFVETAFNRPIRMMNMNIIFHLIVVLFVMVNWPWKKEKI